MTREEYFGAIAVFQKLCEQQPNLFTGISPGAISGNSLAKTLAAFVEEHVKLQNGLLKG